MENGIAGKRILIIDDDARLCALITDYLSMHGMECQCVHTGVDGLSAAAGDWDAILLDMMLPGMDGLDVLRELRASRVKTPVIIISALGEASDRIVGLEMGADDYVPKTFSPRELLAHLRALFRRISPETGEEEGVLRIRGLVLRADSMTAELDGKKLDLTILEFRLLQFLAANAGTAFSREELCRKLFERPLGRFDRSIDVHVSSLRKKLGDSSREPRFIVTMRSSGYMFIR